MILEASDLPKRRLLQQLNDIGSCAVDSELGSVFGGQQRQKDFKGFTRVAIELLAVVGHFYMCLEAHKFIDTVQDVG